MKIPFTVKAAWDEDAGVFYSESDIDGLHIEAATLEEFQGLVEQHAPELIVANHISINQTGEENDYQIRRQ